MLGENVLGSTIHFAEALRHQEEHGLPEWDAKGSVYVDLLGHRMVRFENSLPDIVSMAKPTRTFALYTYIPRI